MIAENFKWWATRYITVDDIGQPHEFDMHNDFDFLNMSYSPYSRDIRLHWKRSTRDNLSENLPETIHIDMRGISEMRWLPRDKEMPFTEDICLSSFGYWDGDEQNEYPFWVEQLPKSDWYWSFEFQSGAILLVLGEYARIDVQL